MDMITAAARSRTRNRAGRPQPRRACDRAAVRWWPQITTGALACARMGQPHWPLIRTDAPTPGRQAGGRT